MDTVERIEITSLKNANNIIIDVSNTTLEEFKQMIYSYNYIGSMCGDEVNISLHLSNSNVSYYNISVHFVNDRITDLSIVAMLDDNVNNITVKIITNKEEIDINERIDLFSLSTVSGEILHTANAFDNMEESIMYTKGGFDSSLLHITYILKFNDRNNTSNEHKPRNMSLISFEHEANQSTVYKESEIICEYKE